MTTEPKDEAALMNTLRKWIFGPLLSVLGTIIVLQLNEIKTDIKSLLVQTGKNTTRIDNLERVVYKENSMPSQSYVFPTLPTNQYFSSWNPTYFINEEEFELNKKLKKV